MHADAMVSQKPYTKRLNVKGQSLDGKFEKKSITDSEKAGLGYVHTLLLLPDFMVRSLIKNTIASDQQKDPRVQ